ncbi:hypothetical protein CBL_01246 [Carabus blaptoides fortunei]
MRTGEYVPLRVEGANGENIHQKPLQGWVNREVQRDSKNASTMLPSIQQNNEHCRQTDVEPLCTARTWIKPTERIKASSLRSILGVEGMEDEIDAYESIISPDPFVAFVTAI